MSKMISLPWARRIMSKFHLNNPPSFVLFSQSFNHEEVHIRISFTQTYQHCMVLSHIRLSCSFILAQSCRRHCRCVSFLQNRQVLPPQHFGVRQVLSTACVISSTFANSILKYSCMATQPSSREITCSFEKTAQQQKKCLNGTMAIRP